MSSDSTTSTKVVSNLKYCSAFANLQPRCRPTSRPSLVNAPSLKSGSVSRRLFRVHQLTWIDQEFIGGNSDLQALSASQLKQKIAKA